MQAILPSCFRNSVNSVAASSPSPSISSQLALTTSVFETPLGIISLSWSHSTLTLSLLSSSLHFHVKPWSFFRRRSSKSFPLNSHHCLRVFWDLRRAQFPPSGGPEPSAGFHILVSVDGEPILASGDLADQEFTSVLVSRREHVLLAGDGRRPYKTAVRYGGREHEVFVEVGMKGAEDEGMAVIVDGERVLEIRRLRWKFRGTEMVELGRGGRVFVSWDLHKWLFSSKDSSDRVALALPERGPGVFVFRFENEEGYFGNFREDKVEGNLGMRSLDGGIIEGYFGKRNSSGGRRGWFSWKTDSSSSFSSAGCSTTSSSVIEWASQEEVELQKSEEGFTLILYIWKSN